MSWILGYIGATSGDEPRVRCAAIHEAPLVRTPAHPTLYVAAGGLASTCLHGSLPGSHGAGWAVVGLGLLRDDSGVRPLTAADWADRLAPTTPNVEDLDGHFVTVRWDPTRPLVTCCTDVLGLRTLYLAPYGEGTAFSTRLDWLAAFTGHRTLDLEALGSHWLTFNQLSTRALVTGMRRLGAGGRATLAVDGSTYEEEPWKPPSGTADASTYARILDDFLAPSLPSGAALSLGLSGGLDSRLLLACHTTPPRATHVFGDPAHPDVRVSTRIARSAGLPHRHFHDPVPDTDTCLALLRTHVAQTQAVSAASSVLGLRYYPRLREERYFLIDGGFGEASRRQFMNRLLRRGGRALKSGDPVRLAPFFAVHRVDVFTDEARAALHRGLQQDLGALWARLPRPPSFGRENAMDLLSVWTRLPNFFGFEQNRLDGLIANYMPFAQPSLLRVLFQVPVSERRNGRLFRRLIRRRAPALTAFPLVKGNVTYPYHLPTLPAYFYARLKTRLRGTQGSTTREVFLRRLTPYLQDTVRSTPVRAFAAYDGPRLVRLIDDFVSGRASRASEVDWWLAFDTWRSILSGA